MLKKLFILFLVAIVLFVPWSSFKALARQEPLEHRAIRAFDLTQEIGVFHMRQILSLRENRELIEKRVRKYEFGKNWDKLVPLPEISAKEVVAGAILEAPLPLSIIGMTEVLVGIAKIGLNAKKDLVNEYISIRKEVKSEEGAWQRFKGMGSNYLGTSDPNLIGGKRPLSGRFAVVAGINRREIVRNPEGEHARAVRTYFAFVWEAIEMSERRGMWAETRNRLLVKSQKISDYLLTKPPSISERIGGVIGSVGGAVIVAGQSIWRGVQNIGQRTWDTIQRIDLFGAGVVPVTTEQVPPALSPPTQLGTEIDITQVQKTIDELTKQVDILNKEVGNLVVKTQTQAQIISRKEEQTLAEEKKAQNQKEAICLKNSIEINSTSEQELLKIIGVGQVRAVRIIEARPFCSLDDLSKILGIGDVTLQRIKEQGCAYVDVKNVKECEKIKDEQKDKKEEQKDISCLPNSIDINSASKQDLDKIIHIGTERAVRIIAARPFSSIDDLLRVSGIGTITLQRIKEQGCAYVRVVWQGGGGGGAPLPLTPLSATPTAALLKILINEIQIEGEGGEKSHDFIELFNPATTSVNISGYRLRKRTSGVTELSIRVFPDNSIIPALGYFIWANSDYALTGKIIPNTTTTQTIALNNSIALLAPSPNNTIIDAVAWGTSTNPFIEPPSFPQNPKENESLGRKWSSTTEGGYTYIDTDNNQNDFEIQRPTPGARNQSIAPEPSEPVNQLPIAKFVHSPPIPFVNQEINFDASSSTDPGGQIVSFVWDFGDGTATTTTSTTTTHRYSTSSSFLVQLIVVDNQSGTNSATTTIIVSKPLQIIWDQIFENNFGGQVYAVQQDVQSNGYVITGKIGNALGGWFIKTSDTGIYKSSNVFRDTFDRPADINTLSVQQTTDGGFVITGRKAIRFYGGSFTTYMAPLVKFNKQGKREWGTIFGNGMGAHQEMYLVEQTTDHGFILTGSITMLGEENRFFLLKTDATGTYQWSNMFRVDGCWKMTHSIQQTTDYGFIIAGEIMKFHNNAWDTNALVIKTSATGTYQWSRLFGGSGMDKIHSVQQTRDEGFILAGYTNSFGSGEDDFWLIKINSMGEEEWSRTFGGTGAERAFSVLQTTDAGFIMAGLTNSFGAGNYDFWLVKTDINGNKEWSQSFGGLMDDIPYSILEATDGGFIVVGQTHLLSDLGEPPDIWLMKVGKLN